MGKIYSYESNPYQRALDVEVLSTGQDAGRHFALLDDTILYPEGGGQPADHGSLGPARVVDVQRRGGELRHLLDRPVAAGPAKLTLDWRRRFDHMQQHTAQHLLTAVAADRKGWKTTSFHLQPEVCDIELDAGSISPPQLDELEDAVAAEIRAGRPITARRVSPAEYAASEARSRGLPEGHEGDVRLVEIEGIDVNTCGGTHLRSTAEIESVKLLGVEPARGGCRLRWIAGARVRRRLAAAESRLAELRGVLGAADGELAAVAKLKLDQLKESSRRERTLASRLAEATADALATRVAPALRGGSGETHPLRGGSGETHPALRGGSGETHPVVAEHFDDADARFLQLVARRFSSAAHRGLALLTASGDQGSFFVLAAGEGCEVDVQEAGRRVAEILGARGGGSGRLFQGKAESLDGKEEAERVLVTAARP